MYGDTEAAKSELGIYGACVKIAMIMAMITQAFRYAYEPFVFGKAKDKNSGETYATIMKFFIIFTLLAYLCVIGYMDILKRIIAPDYWPGLRVVPIVMAAEIMMGVYFNLSFWYKLIDKTIWGAWFSLPVVWSSLPSTSSSSRRTATWHAPGAVSPDTPRPCSCPTSWDRRKTPSDIR